MGSFIRVAIRSLFGVHLSMDLGQNDIIAGPSPSIIGPFLNGLIHGILISGKFYASQPLASVNFLFYFFI